MKRKPKVMTPEQAEVFRTKEFFDMIAPGVIKFMPDHYILGDSYRCTWVIREYPPTTETQAILAQLADRSGVTLRMYHRLVDAAEQRKIIQNAARRNKLMSTGNDVTETIQAEGNLQDVVQLLAELRKNREPLLHCAVFMELKASSLDALKELQQDVSMELTRSKITASWRASSPPCRWGPISLRHSTSACCPAAPRPISTRSTFPARRIPTGSISAGTSSAPTFSPTSTGEARTKPTAMF